MWGFDSLTLGADASAPDSGPKPDGSVPLADGSGIDATADAEDSGTADDASDADCGPTNTIANCGACGVVCDDLHSVPATCDGVKCNYAGCDVGYENCDQSGNDSNGCETPINTVQNCGACGAACDTVQSDSPVCMGGSCVYGGCKAGFADCKATAPDTDGCETPVASGSCAICGVSGCDTSSNSVGGACETTDAGEATCKYTKCAQGFADCNTTPPDTHGCSTPTTTITNCNGCGVTCDTRTSNGTACGTNGCTYSSCASNYADCDTTAPDSNGCETSMLSVATCGSCQNAACDTTTGTPSCNGTTCKYICNQGRSDCNGAAKPPDLDGCECPTPSCCAGACETTHSNGLGQPFYDCTAKSTFTAQEATSACQASGATNCAPSSVCCGALDLLVCVGATAYSVCGTADGQCHCWQYSSGSDPQSPGTVQSPSSCSAACKASGDPSWN